MVMSSPMPYQLIEFRAVGVRFQALVWNVAYVASGLERQKDMVPVSNLTIAVRCIVSTEATHWIKAASD